MCAYVDICSYLQTSKFIWITENELNSNRRGRGGQGPAEMKEFVPRLYQDIMVLENALGFDYFIHDMKT